MWKRTLVYLLVGLSVPVSAAANEKSLAAATSELRSIIPRIEGVAVDAHLCGSGLVYDDGNFENGLKLNTSDGRLVQRFDPAVFPASLQAVCICWQRISSDTSINFNIQVYAQGAGGVPGNLLTSIPASATGIPNGLGGKFYRYDLSAAGINVSANTFVGVQVNGITESSIYLCTDEGPAPARSAYASVNGGAFWGSMVVLDPLFEAFGLRTEFSAPSSGCIPSATSLCLNQSRFKVEATFQTPAGQSGTAQVVKLTDETGYLWFFNSSNVEGVVKVINGCALNNRYWVFAGGLTDVLTVITVTDTQTGTVKTYTNPQSTAFKPIQDTSAFATCP